MSETNPPEREQKNYSCSTCRDKGLVYSDRDIIECPDCGGGE